MRCPREWCVREVLCRQVCYIRIGMSSRMMHSRDIVPSRMSHSRGILPSNSLISWEISPSLPLVPSLLPLAFLSPLTTQSSLNLTTFFGVAILRPPFRLAAPPVLNFLVAGNSSSASCPSAISSSVRLVPCPSIGAFDAGAGG